LYYSFLGGAGLYRVGNAPDVGWFAYAPLTTRSFSPGHATDYWALALMWGGRIRFTTPMLFCIGFLFQFLLAGLTGIMLSVSPWDWQLHNSYFVIAHFHYVLVGAIVFCIFAAVYFWYPKATGRLMSETLSESGISGSS
jgi:heme/copper-type cytochrome/quinol oxidase subunit 1